MHLLNIPAQTYLIYRPVNEWVEANVKSTEAFPKMQTVIYRLQGVDVSRCEGLTALMKIVDEAIEYSDDSEEDISRDIDSDGWTASSAFSYPNDKEKSDILAEGQGDDSSDNDCVDGDDEVVPSSQGSLEFFYH